MAKELKHKALTDSVLYEADNWDAIETHYILGGANDDILVYDSINAKLVGKQASEILTIILTTGDYIEIQTDMDYSTIRAQGKPTDVHRGVFNGFSLPIYSSDNEEVFFKVHIPHDWDEASDPIIIVYGYLASANTSKNFKLRVHWENVTPGTDIYPATDNDVDVQTATGTASQYQSFELQFTIDYDIDTPADIARGDVLGLLLHRIAASSNEISGEFVITEVKMKYKRNRLGATS